MSGTEMLRTLFSTEDTKDESVSFPLPEAQAMELRSRWESAQTTIDLKPGDLVTEKHGLGYRKGPYRKAQLMILWRMLDLNVWIDRQHMKQYMRVSSADQPDCLVAYAHEDSSSIMIQPHELNQLQRWEPESNES